MARRLRSRSWRHSETIAKVRARSTTAECWRVSILRGWDAPPFSLSGISAAKPSYNNIQFGGGIGGPLGIPRHLISNSQFFVNFQHQADDESTATARSRANGHGARRQSFADARR